MQIFPTPVIILSQFYAIITNMEETKMEFIFLTLILILASQPQEEEAYWICAEPLKEEDGYLVCDLEKINP